jgi:hypothetical protein
MTYLDRAPEAETVTVMFEVPADISITKVLSKTSTGTLSLQVQSNDAGTTTSVGSSISVTSSLSTTNISPAVDVDAGEALEFVISSVVDAEDLSVQVVWVLR